MRILFLNGWSANERMLMPLRELFSDAVEFVCLNDVYQFSEQDVFDEIEKYIDQHTVLMGWSLGGMLALAYCCEPEKRTQPMSLVLLNTPLRFSQIHDFVQGVALSEIEQLSRFIELDDSVSLIRVFSHLLVAGSSTYKEDRGQLKAFYLPETLSSQATLLKGLEYLKNLDLREKNKQLKVPLLTILGAQDALIDANANSEFEDSGQVIHKLVVGGMGHYPFGAQFAEWIGACLEFIHFDQTKSVESLPLIEMTDPNA